MKLGEKQKHLGNKSHGPNISQDAIVAVVKVNTKNVCGRPGGGRDTTTSHWPLNVHFCTPRPVYLFPFHYFLLHFLGYRLRKPHLYHPKKKKKTTPSATYIGPKHPPKKNTKPTTNLPTYQNQTTRFRQNPVFFSYPFRRRWTEPFGLPRWAAHGFFASQRRCWVHRRPSTHQRWETSNGEDVSKLHVTWRAVTWQVGNWLVGWLVGWIGFFFPASKNTIRGLGGMDVFFFPKKHNWDNYLFFTIIFAKLQRFWKQHKTKTDRKNISWSPLQCSSSWVLGRIFMKLMYMYEW